MRYPVRNNETTQGAMNRSRIHQRDSRLSTLAIEELIQLQSSHGIVVRRRLKILRLEKTPSREDQPVAPRGQVARRGSEPEPTEHPRNGKHIRLRSVGEVVTDATGHFYEVRGGQLHPLGELVRNERGRIFEVNHSGDELKDGATNAGMNGGRAEADDPSCAVRGSKTELNVNQQSGPSANSTRLNSTPPRVEKQPGYQKILADPGLYLEIPFARVKDEIAPQLKYPERLKDDCLIECYAQIYEAQRTMSVASMAATELGDGDLHSQLHPLTRRPAEMLGVPQLFKPTRNPFEIQASTRQIYAGQRLYRLWPVFDPTVVELGAEAAARSRSDTGKHEKASGLIDRILRKPLRRLKTLTATKASESTSTDGAEEIDRSRAEAKN